MTRRREPGVNADFRYQWYSDVCGAVHLNRLYAQLSPFGANPIDPKIRGSFIVLITVPRTVASKAFLLDGRNLYQLWDGQAAHFNHAD